MGREGALWAGPGSLGAAACRRLVALTMAACPASAGRMGQAGIRAAHSCHVLSWEGHGVKQPRGPRTQGLRRLLNLPVPCLPDCLAGLSATGIGERPSLQLLKPERPPESPPIISALPHGVQTRAQRQPPRPRGLRPRDAPAQEVALTVRLAGPSLMVPSSPLFESVHRPNLGFCFFIFFYFLRGRGLILKIAEFRNTFTRILILYFPLSAFFFLVYIFTKINQKCLPVHSVSTGPRLLTKEPRATLPTPDPSLCMTVSS